MPNVHHEAIVQLFRNDPKLAPMLLRDVLHVELPRFRSVTVEDVELTEVNLKNYRPDGVAMLRLGKKLVGAVAIEVQFTRKVRKRKVWPLYITHLGHRLGCPVCLLVVTTSASLARWCVQPIPTGHPGFDLVPLVIGPEGVPVITDPAEAKRLPELAVLSVMTHGRSLHGLAIGQAVITSARGLDEERATFYTDITCDVVNAAARAALETMMKGYEYQSEFAKKYFGQGMAKGMAEGKAEGEAKGKAEGEAEAVLAVLEARGIKVSKANQRRIARCTDLGELGRWIRRAPFVTKAAELFEPAPS